MPFSSASCTWRGSCVAASNCANRRRMGRAIILRTTFRSRKRTTRLTPWRIGLLIVVSCQEQSPRITRITRIKNQTKLKEAEYGSKQVSGGFASLLFTRSKWFFFIRVIRVIRGGCCIFRQVRFKETQHALAVFFTGDLKGMIVLGIFDQPQLLR